MEERTLGGWRGELLENGVENFCRMEVRTFRDWR